MLKPVGISSLMLAWIFFSCDSLKSDARRSNFSAAMPQPMSTPTAFGLTAVFEAKTDPIVAPAP
jgi:hypothetical protein